MSTPVKIAILDDYQNCALSMADWSVLPPEAEITVFTDNIADFDALDIAGVFTDPDPHRRVDGQVQGFQPHLPRLWRAGGVGGGGKMLRPGEAGGAGGEGENAVGVAHGVSGSGNWAAGVRPWL